MARYGCDTVPVQWPTDAEDGDTFSYLCPISGASFVTFVRFMGTWQHLCTE